MNVSPEAFDAIRPYRDEEVEEVMARLAEDSEFLTALLRFKFPRLTSSILAPAAKFFISRTIKKHAAKIHSVHDLQLYVEGYMARMLATTTKGLTVDGLENLDPKQSYLFISNHRDIAMDPAMVNYALHTNGMNTVRIAIGDNLLKKSWVTDLMRLNKSFIVQRSAKGVRQMMASFKLLSEYIHHSLKEENHSIWIAQREGRAKNGIDHTDPAIIKMFYMAEKKSDKSFAEVIGSLNLVPVALSYEYDPLDVQKARELATKEQEGEYAKSEFEDIQSIAQGIAGFKGRIHLAFGKPLQAEDLENADVAAKAVDAQIRKLYRLFPSNYLALEALGEEDDIAFPEFDTACSADFNEHLAACPPEYRKHWLTMYANPVKNYLGRL
ncbi:glycerol-3-phosphate acyltransferase [Marinospirillum celere]|uniref:Glycerol-3-phosphate acyltransferase n=2 Tax=Marinospirillum celere TaxID=1122252 RepID=A0A1I1E2J5_9GAMM|nr:glycerol-3-phosphate acyltransferase [Marinospirillum celere]